MAKLNISFEVDDDLSSEKVADYKAVVVAALVDNLNRNVGNAAYSDSNELIDKLLNDWEK